MARQVWGHRVGWPGRGGTGRVEWNGVERGGWDGLHAFEHSDFLIPGLYERRGVLFQFGDDATIENTLSSIWICWSGFDKDGTVVACLSI